MNEDKFKNVEYVGFDEHPDQEAKARQLTEVLANEIRTWREDVEVRWNPHPDPTGVLDLTLSLTLPNGVSDTRTGTFTENDFSRPSWLASRCRRVWSGLLGGLIEQLDNRIQSWLFEPAGA
jgi:hypothetical protein